MKKVLVISSEFPPGPGGLGSHAFSLCKALKKNGYQPMALSPGDYLTRVEVESFDRSQAFPIKRFTRKGILTYFLRFIHTARTIKTNMPHEIILSGKFPVWMIRWLKMKWPHLSVQVFLHGSEIRLPQRWARWLFNYNLKRADLLYPVSRFTYQLLPEKLRNGHPFQIIPNGIDLREMEELNRQAPPNQLKGSPSLLTIGNVTPRKGQHRVIRVLPELIKQYPDLHYHIVGMPTNKKTLVETATNLGVNSYITFHGHIKDRVSLASYYKACDIFIMLSENQDDGDVEGFGIAILEANFFGKPVIGAKGCGIEQAVRDHYNGILVDGDHPREVSEAINTITQDPVNFKKQAMNWSLEHDWNHIVKNFIT